MKKIYSIALAAVAILSAASCQKELVNDNFDAAGEKFTVTAVASADSKTVLDGVNTYWTPGDIIAVYDATGAEVTFSTAITEQAATAKFTADAEFVAPESLVAVYPKRTDRGATTFADGVIKGLHVGGGQTAVAGSFEPKFAVSVGTPKAAGSTELVFTAAHSLVKFTVGGEAAPLTVTLKNNGMRAIAGMFDYNTADGAITMTAGNPYIDVTGNFEVGKTYYIVMTSGVCEDGISLLYDGVEMKNTGETFTAEPNKIYNLGTLPAPVEEPDTVPFEVERVWGYYSTTDAAWWSGIADGFASWYGGDTSLAMDDEYIYIPYGTATAGVYKVSLADGTISNIPVDGVSGGTYPTSCARMVKNTDPSVNGGKDILLVGNLALNRDPLKFYAYVNGTDNAPVCVYELNAARRFGDKFTVSGTWQSGIIWLRSNQDNPLEAVIPINSGALQTWIDAYIITNADDDCISEISWYPVSDNTVAEYCLMSTTSDQGVHLMKGCSAARAATEEAVFPDLAKTFGYKFFEFGGEKYIAWTSLKYGNGKPRLQIIKGDGSSLETLKSALSNINDNLVAEFALSNADNDFELAGKEATKTLCDCDVRVIGDNVYVAALGEESGLSLFKISAK